MYYYSTIRLILNYRPSEGGRLSRPRHCREVRERKIPAIPSTEYRDESTLTSTLTSNADLGVVFNASKFGRRHARVRGRLTHVRQLQDVLSDGRRCVELTGHRRHVDRATPPADVRHRGPNGDTGQVDGASLDHFGTLRKNGEVWRNSANWQLNATFGQ